MSVPRWYRISQVSKAASRQPPAAKPLDDIAWQPGPSRREEELRATEQHCHKLSCLCRFADRRQCFLSGADGGEGLVLTTREPWWKRCRS